MLKLLTLMKQILLYIFFIFCGTNVYSQNIIIPSTPTPAAWNNSANWDVSDIADLIGETADTLAALQLAKEKGALVLGICNVVGSTLSRETDAGVEIGVASTKAFTAQVTVLTMFALKLAKAKGTISGAEYQELVKELAEIPEKQRLILQNNNAISGF